MANNVARGSFHFYRTKKLFSIFQVSKKGYFVKQPPNESFIMVPPYLKKILDQQHPAFSIGG
jgi:hypothetical protein